MTPDYNSKKQEFVLLHVLTRIIKSEVRDLSHQHHTSMINDAISVAEHFITLREIQGIRTYYVVSLQHQASFQSVVDELIRIAGKYYSNLDDYTQIKSTILDLSINLLRDYFTQIKLVELNRRDEEIDERIIVNRTDLMEFPQELDYFDCTRGLSGSSYIVTGGSRISRGLTLEGLTISLFLRRPEEPNYDTMLQMARWCGYREGYDDLVRIITTPQIFTDYGLINQAESNMRDQIDQMDEHTDPVDSVVWIREQPGRLRVSGKMPLADFLTRITAFKRVIQNEIWTTSPPELYHKPDISFQYFFRLFALTKSKLEKPPKNETGYRVAENIDTQLIREFLSKYQSQLPDSELSASISHIISEITNYPRCNLAIAVPSQEKSRPFFSEPINYTFRMVKRTPNSSNLIQQVYSNYNKSTKIDLMRTDSGILESRTKPLILFYLADNETINLENQKVFSDCNFPVPLFGIIMPFNPTSIEAQHFIRGYREHEVAGPIFRGE